MASETESESRAAGISGMALYVPRLQVDLERWCGWTSADWDKVRNVVGHGFRVCAPHENVYTMAANAVLRLIDQYQIDPGRVGLLALGTESSRDNAAGAIIVRGMVDQALARSGRCRLSRSLEVPEFKHACLGGIYALKAALRYVSCDGGARDAIVVAADIAEYERGTTGEQTQGAGAVAMLIQRQARMLRVDLAHAGTASAYRGPDFRKPMARHRIPGYAARTKRLSDFPVFSGKYSTLSYLDEVVHAVEDMLVKIETSDGEFYRSVRALFFHRPYRLMPVQAMSFLFARGLARGTHHRHELEALCAEARVDPRELAREASCHPDLYAAVLERSHAVSDPYPATTAVARVLRGKPTFLDLLEEKLSLGMETVVQLGNLYSAALPAWIAAGIEEAAQRSMPITGQPMVMVGYGSGDAAEAIPMSAVDGWETAARAIRTAEALQGEVLLSREQYEALHDGDRDAHPLCPPQQEFVISRVGERYDPEFQDLGVEYYEYVGDARAPEVLP